MAGSGCWHGSGSTASDVVSDAAGTDAETLVEARYSTRAQVATLEFYRRSPACYNFMGFDETILHLRRAGFDLAATRTGNHELGERCPQVLPGNRQGALRAGAK